MHECGRGRGHFFCCCSSDAPNQVPGDRCFHVCRESVASARNEHNKSKSKSGEKTLSIEMHERAMSSKPNNQSKAKKMKIKNVSVNNSVTRFSWSERRFWQLLDGFHSKWTKADFSLITFCISVSFYSRSSTHRRIEIFKNANCNRISSECRLQIPTWRVHIFVCVCTWAQHASLQELLLLKNR